jgi:purine nucleosidase
MRDIPRRVMTRGLRCLVCAIAAAFGIRALPAQPEYGAREAFIKNFDFTGRLVPGIPPKGRRIRVVIDTDAANEIDDQWAIALALLSPERFQIEGFVAANFDNDHGGPQGIAKSYEEIRRVLDKGGFGNRYPVFRGSDPMRYKFEPSESEGVDFIIRTAMKSPREDPLWIVGLGAATDLASAYLKEPEIRNRARFFWHGRTQWPVKCSNFNVFGDRLAAALLFSAPVPFVLFDTGTNLTCPMEESAKFVRPYGDLGAYLHEYRRTNPWFMQPDKGFYDLGDIAALLDPGIAKWEVTGCPEVDPDLSYRFKGTKGSILRCASIRRDAAFKLLYDRLKAAYPGKTGAPESGLTAGTRP